ncbi:response regulator [Deinococcus hopiensis]|uniref:Response regulators consisting of a CheY-like receiver domain and a winged-helix DNA-binding domain n=1 Tax=Deinococcus hopiensis KR-140 TaxID=695939 RepID=A0A1W1UHL8_9DEIO|nr:response regulator [Deinococcus hopiensis]SMB80254.1 Response regulators consisting of a CheY-like receiver domain and a winged-helix DNA-binding domain [Deinococcus hopiensis KR-140]
MNASAAGPNPKRLLLVDDNPADLELARYAFEEAGVDASNIDMVRDGEEALQYLRRQGDYAGRITPHPTLVLLDVNMPRLNGVETLQRLKADPILQTLPVVMLTTSGHAEDMERSYRHGANGYVVKPVDLAAFLEVARTLRAFWMNINLAYTSPRSATPAGR